MLIPDRGVVGEASKPKQQELFTLQAEAPKLQALYPEPMLHAKQ